MFKRIVKRDGKIVKFNPDKITDAILENDYESGHTFQISCCADENEVVVA